MSKSLLIALAILVPLTTFAQTVPSGAEVLRKVNERISLGVSAPEVAKYKSTLASMSAEEAGKGWAALLLIPPTESDMVRNEVWTVLPPPASWPAISQTLQAKSQDPVMLAIATTLVSDKEGLKAALRKLIASSTVTSDQVQGALAQATKLKDFPLAKMAIEKVVTLENQKLEGNTATDEMGNFSYAIPIPDLVTAFGKEQANQLLLGVFKSAKFLVSTQGATDRVALEVARSHVGEFAIAQYDLIANAGAIDLYPAMAKRPAPTGKGADKTARAIYRLVQASQGDVVLTGDTADWFSTGESYSLTTSLEKLSKKDASAKNLFTFFDNLMAAKPAKGLLSDYANLAIRTGQEQVALKRVQPLFEADMAKTDPDNQTGQESGQAMSSLLAATGDVDRFVALTLKRVDHGLISPNELIIDGKLLSRPDLVKKGVDMAISKDPQEAIPYLIKEKRYAEAVQSFLNAGIRAPYGQGTASTSPLVPVYVDMGRFEDAVFLIEHDPSLDVDDIADLFDPTRPSAYLGVYSVSDDHADIIKAYVGIGKKKEAIELLDLYIKTNPANDIGYELGMALWPKEERIFRLEKWATNYPLEKRPLIWKAKVLLEQGDVDGAEKTVRAAIAIDPSDGFAPMGHRFLAYSVLADVLEKKGDPAGAGSFRSAVKAIRMSEEADQWLAQGFIKKATQLYSDSLNLFADAYCIQSRLAVQLLHQGHRQEAMEHFRRAFQLMPTSFGRIETHCLGCEGVLDDDEARSLAEQVIKEEIAKDPKHPQSYALLAEVYIQAERYPEALDNLRKAVALDPDYIDAWKRYDAIADKVTIPPEELAKAEENILRLNVLNRFAMYGFDQSKLSLKETYLKAAQKKSRTPILPVVRQKSPAIGEGMVALMRGEQSPGQAVAQHEDMQWLVSGMGGNGGYRRYYRR